MERRIDCPKCAPRWMTDPTFTTHNPNGATFRPKGRTVLIASLEQGTTVTATIQYGKAVRSVFCDKCSALMQAGDDCYAVGLHYGTDTPADTPYWETQYIDVEVQS